MDPSDARLGLFVLLSSCGMSGSPASQPARAVATESARATVEAVAAAQALLATLDDAGRAKVAFPFGSDQKSKWSNFPVGAYPRNGLRLGDLTSDQRSAVMKLLGTALSRAGLEKVRAIMEGDEVLKNSDDGHRGPPGRPGEGPGNGPPGGGAGMGPPPGAGGPGAGWKGPSFGHDDYYLALLGAPSLAEPWMIQFGGHHLAINLTIVGKDQAMTPSLPCAQPAIYKLEGQTVRPLGREQDESLALIRSLDDSQKQKAILPYQVSDLVLGPGQDGKTIPPEGIEASDLNEPQRRMLLDLAHEWVGILNDEAAAARMADIEAHVRDTWFAWSGPTAGESPAYFRIQGPTLLIEYAPQRSRGSGGLDADHIHTIYRDPTNDYGARLLKR